MNLVARENVVIAVRESGERTTASGIAIASTVSSNFATVVGLGPCRSQGDQHGLPWDFKVGDQIVVGRDPMNTILENGVEYEFYRSADVIAVSVDGSQVL